MNKILQLFLCLSIMFMTGCNQTDNGTYIVYKTENPPKYGLGESGEDFDASDKLGEDFKGKKFQFEFHDQYIIMKEENRKEEMVLDQKKMDDGNLYYELVYKKGNEKWNFRLYNDLATEQQNITLTIKIDVFKIDQIGNPQKIKYANTRCELKKYH